MDILQLVTAQLCHHDRVFLQLVEDVEQRDADIASQNTTWQQVMYQRRRSALALGAGDADSHVTIHLEEEVGEGSEVKGER